MWSPSESYEESVSHGVRKFVISSIFHLPHISYIRICTCIQCFQIFGKNSWRKKRSKAIRVTGRGGRRVVRRRGSHGFSKQSAHRRRQGCQPYAPAALYPSIYIYIYTQSFIMTFFSVAFQIVTLIRIEHGFRWIRLSSCYDWTHVLAWPLFKEERKWADQLLLLPLFPPLPLLLLLSFVRLHN
jgi:hypothetical protein